MLKTAIIYEAAFEKYEEEESSFRVELGDSIPEFDDWLVVKKFTSCLEHFYLTTIRISGSLYVTANMHFQEICDLNVLLKDMISNDDFEVMQVGEKMKSKFDKYRVIQTK